MPQIVINNANIGTFSFKVIFDILNRQIRFDASATSYNGGGISVVKGIAFALKDQDGVDLAVIDFSAPQIPTPSTGQVWVYDASAINFQFLFQAYSIQGAIQDQDGTIYTTAPVIKTICQPTDLTDSGYVPGLFNVFGDCVNNVLEIKELTLLVYNNLKPSSVSKSGTLYYPTGTIAAIPFTLTPFSNNVVYTGEYRVKCTTVAEYSLGDDVYVDVSYVTDNVFNITCVDAMSSILCCIQQVQKTYIDNCNNAKGGNAKQLIDQIAMPFMIGLAKERNGQDPSTEAAFIKKVLNCDCGTGVIKQNEPSPVNPSIYNIVLVGVGGTTIPAPIVTGSTKTFNVGSGVYQVVKGNPSDLAFTIAIDTSVANTVKYLITFNYAVMAASNLTAIGASPSLTAQLNALVSATGVDLSGLDGKCVIDMTHVDYSLSQSITGLTIITNIVINGIIFNAPANLFASNQSAVLSWLNSLSLGTFSVNVAANIISILSTANTNVISTMTFTSPNTTVQFSAHNNSLVQVLQAIITYLCELTALQIALGNNIGLCIFDYNGDPETINYTTGDTQDNFNVGVSQAICNLVARIETVQSVTCDKLKTIFSDNPSGVFGPSDRIYGTLNGGCAGLTDQQLALVIFAAVGKYTNVKDAFCAISCAAPVTCPDITNINMSILSASIIGIYGTSFSGTPTGSQTVTVKYRVTGTTSWLTSTTSLVLFPNGNVSVSPPYQIPGLTPGTQYDVWIQNNCGGTGFIKQITTPSNTLYSDSFLLDNSAYSICAGSPVTLYSSIPFAPGVTMYVDNTLLTPITGFNFIALVSSGNVYNLDSGTGVVGSATGNNCSSGTPGTYGLSNTGPGTCGATSQILYSNGTFAPGVTLYTDSALTNPVTGFLFVLQTSTNKIFNLDSTTGLVGSDTGTMCTTTTVRITSSMVGCTLTNVSGISGFTPSPALPMSVGGTVTGTHGAFAGSIALTISGTPFFNPSNITLHVDGVPVACVNVTSSGIYTFGSRSYGATQLIEIFLNTGSC